ncbi:MAG: rhodanese-like domain-containing protein [Bdellovibrionales bacterium]|nr:rhodanese-like domain-containing protein [Bdellovibrionales bacterium]
MSEDSSPFQNLSPNPFFRGVVDVSPLEVNQWKDKVTLIDVRQPDEYTGELGHIPNSKLVPLGVFPQHLGEFTGEKTVVLVCRSGNRSAQAAAFAKENGISKVVNMAGGMMAWNEHGLEVSREESRN